MIKGTEHPNASASRVELLICCQFSVLDEEETGEEPWAAIPLRCEAMCSARREALKATPTQGDRRGKCWTTGNSLLHSDEDKPWRAPSCLLCRIVRWYLAPEPPFRGRCKRLTPRVSPSLLLSYRWPCRWYDEICSRMCIRWKCSGVDETRSGNTRCKRGNKGNIH